MNVVLFLVFFGVQNYQSGIDKIEFCENKTEMFTLKDKSSNILYYSYPKEFGALSHIYRIPAPGLKMPVKDIISSWEKSEVEINGTEYIIYYMTVITESSYSINYEFTFD